MSQRKPRSIAVVGTLTRDTTTYADGTQTQNLGGTHYALLTLVSLFQGGARIVPVANVGQDAFAQILSALDLPGIDPCALREVQQANNHVYLTYRNAEERDEVLVGLVPPVSLEHCLEAASLDWILVNLTSGRDIELETLEELRRKASCIQLDVHSLTLGFDPQGRRFPRRPPEWKRWVSCADWLQMNELEASLLGGDQKHPEFARRLLDLGPRGVFITLGSRGCLCVWRDAGGVQLRNVAVDELPQPAYPTGCGDVFGASFAYAMLEGASPEPAAVFANAVASKKAGFEPYQELLRLREHVALEHARYLPQV